MISAPLSEKKPSSCEKSVLLFAGIKQSFVSGGSSEDIINIEVLLNVIQYRSVKWPLAKKVLN